MSRFKEKKGEYRSGFEKSFRDYLDSNGISFSYESEKISFVEPEKKRTYTPDFILPKKNGRKMYIETKGRWTTADRMKIRCVVEQNPDKDIRILFQSDNPIRKGSKTRYTDYARKIGVKCAVGDSLPSEWVKEIYNQ